MCYVVPSSVKFVACIWVPASDLLFVDHIALDQNYKI
jgi:hypothetical protein